MKKTVTIMVCLLSLFLRGASSAGTGPGGEQSAAPSNPPFAAADQWPRAVVESGDGFLYLAGNSFSREQGMGYWLWKLDENGDPLWKKHFRSQYQDEVRSLAAAPGGGVMVLGQIFVYEPDTGYRSWITRIDAGGNTVFEKKLRGFGWSDVLLGTADGDYLFAGTARRATNAKNGKYDFRVLKFDPQGAVLWEMYYNKGGDESAFSGSADNRRNFLFAGTSGKYDRSGTGEVLGWLVKIDDSGSLLGETRLPDCEAMTSGDYLAGTDREFAVVYSITRRPSAQDVRPLTTSLARILAFDENLNPLWRLTRGGYAPGTSPMIAVTRDKNYLTAGAVRGGVRIDKIAGSGSLIWEKRIELAPDDRRQFTVESLIVRKNAAFIAGSVENPEDGPEAGRVFLLKVDTGLGETLLEKIY